MFLLQQLQLSEEVESHADVCHNFLQQEGRWASTMNVILLAPTENKDFTHVGRFVLNLRKTTRRNTQPRKTAGEGTNVSGVVHATIVENAEAMCNEPLNFLYTRGVKERVKTLRQDD